MSTDKHKVKGADLLFSSRTQQWRGFLVDLHLSFLSILCKCPFFYYIYSGYLNAISWVCTLNMEVLKKSWQSCSCLSLISRNPLISHSVHYQPRVIAVNSGQIVTLWFNIYYLDIFSPSKNCLLTITLLNCLLASLKWYRAFSLSSKIISNNIDHINA